MTSEQFAYWLQGYAELNESPPTAEQWQAIREHLALVFDKVTSAPHWFDQAAFISPTVKPSYPWDTRTISFPPDYTMRTTC